MNNPYAIGKKTYLRAPTARDVEGRWHEWFSDPETTQYLMDRHWPNTVDRQRDFFETLQQSSDRLVLSIVDVETNKHIGVCSLSSINWIHRYADVALVIGEKEFRTGPTAVEAVSLLLSVAFLRLNLLNLKGAFLASNPLTQLIVQIFGFEIVGRFKGLYYFKGEYVDSALVQLPRSAWLQRNPQASRKR